MKNTTLFYKSPAANWLDAFPIGNGRIGAMVYGGASREEIQLNEESLWTGFVDKISDNPDCKKNIDRMRALLFAGKTAECEELASKYLVCGGYGTKYHDDRPWAFGSFSTAGQLFIEYEGCEEFSDFKRTLDIKTGEVFVNYKANGINFERRAVASFADNAVMISTKADKPFSAKISYEREDVVYEELEDSILVRGQLESLLWSLAFKPKTDGEIRIIDRVIEVKGATYLEVALSIATDYRGLIADPTAAVFAAIDGALNKGFAAVEKETTELFLSLMTISDIDLGAPEWDIPIDEKITVLQGADATAEQKMQCLSFFGRWGVI